MGKPARAFAKAAEGLQDALGELNDAVVAEHWLARWGRDGRSVEELRGAEALAASERSRAERLRGEWQMAWEKLADPELRAWM